MANVLILGARGFLGSELSLLLESMGHSVLRHARSQGDFSSDLTKSDPLQQFLDNNSVTFIINCVAQADVNLCDQQPQVAYDGNCKTVAMIMQAAESSRVGTRVIHISTDHNYDGDAASSEDAKLQLRNYYGLTKYIGECIVLRHGGVVLRTNFVGKSSLHPNTGFLAWMVDAAQRLDERKMRLFTNVVFCPLSFIDLARAICAVISSPTPGRVWNLGSAGGMSKADFGERFLMGLGLYDQRIERAAYELEQYEVYRPSNMSMDSGSFERYYSIQLPSTVDVCDKQITEFVERQA